MNLNPKHYVCPFTFDWLENPILLPCCGKQVSKDPMIEYWKNNKNCLFCRNNLSINFRHFNPETEVIVKDTVYAIEDLKKNNVPIPVIPKQDGTWEAKLHYLKLNNVFQTKIGQLEIINSNNNFKFKNLLIPVIDKSGSMIGSPFNQVKYSLQRIVDLAYKYPEFITNIISYSDWADNILLDTNMPINHNIDLVNRMSTGGGTSFGSAFKQIIEVCKSYESNPDITAITIIFLTDGEDSYVQKDKRKELVDNFKKEFETECKKNYTIHTIGFGGSHDFDFLTNLRLSGKTEGAYRYADPTEDSDSLCNKINSVLDAIVSTVFIPIEIVDINNNIKIIHQNNNKFWVNLTGANFDEITNIVATINTNLCADMSTKIQTSEDNELFSKWYAYLIDKIAEELLILSKQDRNLDTEIHFELLIQRCNSIMNLQSNHTERITKILETIKTMKSGGSVNISKLNDMKFEGTYVTSTNKNMPNIVPHQILANQVRNNNYRPWNMIYHDYKIRRLISTKKIGNQENNEGFVVMGTYNITAGAEWFKNNVNIWKDALDHNGSNALIVASSVGKLTILREILNAGVLDINYTNNLGYNAIDMSILYGHWKAFEELFAVGCRPSLNIEDLLRTCLSRKFFNTAKRLVTNNLVSVTDDITNSAPTSEIVEWCSLMSQKEISVEVAIKKGIFDVVQKALDTITKISWKDYMEMFSKHVNVDQLLIVDLLLKNGKADANEIVEITTNFEGVVEQETIWPLFAACEKGNMDMFNILKKYTNNFNQQNSKGTTCLWIASCNRHIDIVNELLTLGADPNLPNFKGDSPLIPCCQKGSKSLVELLLLSGARIDVFNRNRDNPILICCRTGQSEILEMLFKKLSAEELNTYMNTYAEIDGFVPLLASTELDKIECIKMCIKYGANLETRSEDTNAIIAGATALHLACHYGRFNSVKTLCDLGADIISQTTVKKYTPLHIAIKQGHILIVRYLLSKDKTCLNVSDIDGRLPIYYANIAGNEEILEEFFTNKLSLILDKLLLNKDPNIDERCNNVLVKYGESPTCFEYENITGLNFNENTSLLTNAILNNKTSLVNTLMTMRSDILQKDDFGVTPLFWANLLNMKISDVQDDHTNNLLKRVQTTANLNNQNKMLLNLSSNSNVFLLDNVKINDKMNDGFNSVIEDKIISLLELSRSGNHSLLQFIDKFRNNKVITKTNKNYLKYMLWDSKIHLIKLVASGEHLLQPIHMLALYMYTGNFDIFKQVNLCLANYKSDNIWSIFVNTLYQGISCLPNCIAEVYRCVDYKFDMNEFKIGKEIVWNTFGICSKEWKTAGELINLKRGMVFIIKSSHGKDISRYSRYPVDQEVIFLPGTKFVISNFYVASVIALGQANIRNTTFKITENDLIKAHNGTSSIIVELQDV